MKHRKIYIYIEPNVKAVLTAQMNCCGVKLLIGSKTAYTLHPVNLIRRFGRLSDVMEDGMPTDIELPELEGQLEDINPAMLQAEEECLDQDIVHVFSPAQPQGRPDEPAHPFGLLSMSIAEILSKSRHVEVCCMSGSGKCWPGSALRCVQGGCFRAMRLSGQQS